MEQQEKNKMMSYKSTDIYVVDTFEEAQQFRYYKTNQPVEVGTPVAYDRPFPGMSGDKAPMVDGERTWKMNKQDMPVMQLVCFDDIYFQEDE
jgi:hypothetical protein